MYVSCIYVICVYMADVFAKICICIRYIYSCIHMPIFITGFILVFCLVNVCLHDCFLGNQSRKMLYWRKVTVFCVLGRKRCEWYCAFGHVSPVIKGICPVHINYYYLGSDKAEKTGQVLHLIQQS